MNLVAMIGNVCTTPEITDLANDKRVARFRIALDRAVGDGADFITVVCWDREADLARDYIDKGRRISVEGRLHHSTWTTDGKKPETRSRVEVVAHRIQLLRRGG